jgi:hypothetical protein
MRETDVPDRSLGKAVSYLPLLQVSAVEFDLLLNLQTPS